MNVLKSLFFLPAFLLLFTACEEKPRAAEHFKEIPVERDSVCTYLLEEDYYDDSTYFPTFQSYFDRKMAQKDYSAAAEALAIVCDQNIYFCLFEPEFLQRVEEFQRDYGNRIPADSATFLDNYIGAHYCEHEQYRRAISYFRRVTARKAVDYYTCNNIGYAYTDMGFCYSAIGDQQRALVCNQKALDYFSRTGNIGGKGNAYNSIYLALLLTKDYPRAEVYLDKAIEAYKQTGEQWNIFIGLHNKILLYEEMDHPKMYSLIDSTYRYFNDSGAEDRSVKIAIYTYYVKKMIHDGDLPAAKKALSDIEEDVEILGSPTSDADYIIARAKYEMANGKEVADIHLIEQALAAAEENEHYQNQLSFIDVLKNDALLKNDFRKALLYSEKEKEANRLMATERMKVRTAELDRKYQVRESHQQIELQKESLLAKNSIIALLVTLLAGFFLLVLILRNRQKQRKSRLEARRAKVFTRQLLEKTEEERKRIAGDLHDSVSHELLSLKRTIGGNDEAGDKIDAILNDIRVISRNLHPIMFEKVRLADSVEQLIERAQSHYDLLVTAEIAYHSSLSVSDELQVYRIIQESLSNTIKYAGAIAAKVTIVETPKSVLIEIRDNGKGFDVEEKLNGPGAFGLHNIMERSRAMGGSATIVSDTGGTIVTVELKKNA